MAKIKVDTGIWSSESVQNLSPEAMSALAYLMVAPQANSIGLFRLAPGSIEKLVGEKANEAIEQLIKSGLILYDNDTECVYVPSIHEDNVDGSQSDRATKKVLEYVRSFPCKSIGDIFLKRNADRYIIRGPSGDEEQIEFLISQYDVPDQKVIRETIAAIKTTRGSGKTASSVILNQLRKWSTLEQRRVIAGCKIYLEKGYYLENKAEEYLLAIIRRLREDQINQENLPYTQATVHNMEIFRQLKREGAL